MLFSEPISVLLDALNEQSCFYEHPSNSGNSSPHNAGHNFDNSFPPTYAQSEAFQAFRPTVYDQQQSSSAHSISPAFYYDPFGINPPAPIENFAPQQPEFHQKTPLWPDSQTLDYSEQRGGELASWPLQSVPSYMHYPANDLTSTYSLNDIFDTLAADSSPSSSFNTTPCSSPHDSHLLIPFPAPPQPDVFPYMTEPEWAHVLQSSSTSERAPGAASNSSLLSSEAPSFESLPPLIPNFPLSSEPVSSAPKSTPAPPPSVPSSSSSTSEPSTRRRKRLRPKKACTNCDITTTPMWRRNPSTHELLCNACGIYLQTRNRSRPTELYSITGTGVGAVGGSASDDAVGKKGPEMPDYSPHADEDWKGRVCDRCETKVTSVWRKDSEGKTVCNACGVYRRMKGRERPLHLKTDRVKPRFKLVGEQPSVSA